MVRKYRTECEQSHAIDGDSANLAPLQENGTRVRVTAFLPIRATDTNNANLPRYAECDNLHYHHIVCCRPCPWIVTLTRATSGLDGTRSSIYRLSQ
jgi:hypothetical protein